jgi:hypothetical protein
LGISVRVRGPEQFFPSCKLPADRYRVQYHHSSGPSAQNLDLAYNLSIIIAIELLVCDGQPSSR